MSFDGHDHLRGFLLCRGQAVADHTVDEITAPGGNDESAQKNNK